MRRLPPMAVVPLAVALVLVLGTCDDQPTIPLPDSPSGEISDAFHGEAGNPHFMWLPPMVTEPETFNGPFDGDSDPVVTVCELTDTGCTLLLHGSTGAEAVYTVSGGPGGVVVQVDPVEEHFLVTWHTDEFNTAVGPTYRVQVALGSTLLGLADLTLTETGKEVTKKNEITGESETIALKDGRTLPVTFRIEEGAICSNPTQPCTTATVDAGEEKTVTLTDEQGEVFSEVRFPSGWAATDENGEPVDALTLTMEKRPVFPTEDPDDPSCFQVVKVNDPETGEPENCPELRLDTDTEFDIRVTFVRTTDGFLPVLTFCPDEDVLASPNLDRYVMTSVEEDVADPAIQNRRTYEGVGGLDCTSSETVGFGGGSSEGLLALGTRLLGSVAALLLPEELWAIDAGFGGELDSCCTIFFFAIDKEAEVVSAPTVTEAPVGADLGTVEVQVRSTHPTVQPLPGEELTFSFMRPEFPVGTFDQPTVVTDPNGIAAHNWTLGTAAGRNTLFIFGEASDTARLEVLGLGRVSLWKGDGDHTDAVGQNHGVRSDPDDGVTQADPLFATGIVNQAFNFDGTGDVVSFPGRNIRTAPHLTVATWVNLDPNGPADDIQRFVTVRPGERAVLRQNNPPEGGARQLHFYMNIDTEGDGFAEDGSDLRHITLDNALATGCWHHVAGTYDGTTMRLYLDGNQVGSLAVSGVQFPNAEGVDLSSNVDAADSNLPEALWGRLDEVEVHNRALTATEVEGIFTGVSSSEKCSPPDLIVESLTHDPADPNELDVIAFTATVKNVGTGPSGPSTLMFKIGGETAGASGTLFSVPALNSGETHVVTRQATLIPQSYINTATADYNGEVTESDETNNTTQDSYTVTEAPDLVVSSMTHSPSSPTTVDQIDFTATVTNQGPGPSRATTLMFKIGGETPGAPATLFSVPPLAVGSSFTANRSLTLGVAQSYLNTAEADWSGDVPETDETNNTATHSYAVSAASGSVSDASGDRSGTSGGDLVAGSITIDAGATFHVDFAPGTRTSDTRATFSLDIDQNAATGFPGVDAANNDASLIGVEYLVQMGSPFVGSTPRVLRYNSSTDSFETVSTSATITVSADSYEVTIPLSVFGGDEGRMNFKVTVQEQISESGFTGIQDYMPDLGVSPGTVN